MKVAHIVAHSPFNEGAGTVAYYVSKELRKLGVDVQVFVPEKRVPEKDFDNSFYTSFRSILSIQNAHLTPMLLKVKGFDIIHLHNPYIFGSELVFIKTLKEEFPLVVTFHNDLIGKGIKGFLFYCYQKDLFTINPEKS